jgi:hypothetical protein
VSVGVNVAPSNTDPGVEGPQEQVATNGVAVVVATAEQPVIAVPAAVKATVPATLAVAVMATGGCPTMALPPLRTIVGVVVAAEALEAPSVPTLVRTMAPTARADRNLFIVFPLFG